MAGGTYQRLLEASQEINTTVRVAVSASLAAGAGAGIGTLFMPGLGTAVGGLIGVIAGAVGAQMSQAKSIREILEDLDEDEREELLAFLRREYGEIARKSLNELRATLNNPVTIALLKRMMANK